MTDQERKEIFKLHEKDTEHIIVDFRFHPEFIIVSNIATIATPESTSNRRRFFFGSLTGYKTYGLNHKEAWEYVKFYDKDHPNKVVFIGGTDEQIEEYKKRVEIAIPLALYIPMFLRNQFIEIFDGRRDVGLFNIDFKTFDIHARNASKAVYLPYKYIHYLAENKQEDVRGLMKRNLSDFDLAKVKYLGYPELTNEQFLFIQQFDNSSDRQMYSDYLRMRRQTESNTPAFPKNIGRIRHLHDELINRVKADQVRYLQKDYERFYPKAKEFEYSDDKFSIVACKTIDELVAEGSTLHHCVGSYAKSIAQGHEYILFLRRNACIKEPFYTIDVVGSKVRQIHGMCNCNMSKEIETFIKEWAKKFGLDISSTGGRLYAL